jgi:UPF0271 protein
MHSIDFNADLGEGYTTDNEVMSFISSANIACGSHAGDEDSMKRAVELCIQHSIAIGAHPGFQDRENFGRKEMHLSHEALFELITRQIFLLKKITASFGAPLHHVKPHGALYNMAAADEKMAAQVCLAIKEVDASLILYGLDASALITEAKKTGLANAPEAFADRAYLDNGQLAPRSINGAVIEDPDQVSRQVSDIVLNNSLVSIHGKKIPVQAKTICMHGDSKKAVVMASHIFSILKKHQVVITTV